MPDHHNTLFRRGTGLISPYIRLENSQEASSADRDSHLRSGIQCLDRVVKIAPNNWSAWWFKGKAFQALGEHRRARGAFQAAYALQPEHPDVAREFMLELLELKEFSQAVKAAEAITNLHPHDAGLRANLALALLLNGDVKGAQKAISESLAVAPNDAISKALKQRIDEVAVGKRKQPSSLQELQAG